MTKSSRGQTTVEYVLMLLVGVGLVLILARSLSPLLRQYMSGLDRRIEDGFRTKLNERWFWK